MRGGAPLEFIPYQLTHCEVEELTMWLLGASDRKVLIYSEDKAKQKYQEQEPGDTACREGTG